MVIQFWFATMRWLLIALLVSLGTLLAAAAGLAHYILRQRALLRCQPIAVNDLPLNPALVGHVDETALKSER